MARASAAQWAKRVENWKESGLSAKEFASETGLKASTLTYWKWKLGAMQRGEVVGAESVARWGKSRTRSSDAGRQRPKGQARAKSVPLVEVPMESVSAPAQPVAWHAIELVVGGSVTVRVPRDFDEATLKRVVRALS